MWEEILIEREAFKKGLVMEPTKTGNIWDYNLNQSPFLSHLNTLDKTLKITLATLGELARRTGNTLKSNSLNMYEKFTSISPLMIIQQIIKKSFTQNLDM